MDVRHWGVQQDDWVQGRPAEGRASGSTMEKLPPVCRGCVGAWEVVQGNVEEE